MYCHSLRRVTNLLTNLVAVSNASNNAVSNVPSQPEEGNKPANKPEVETIKRTVCANVGRKRSVVTNTVTNVNAQPEVETVKSTSRKRSVRTSDNNVPAKSR